MRGGQTRLGESPLEKRLLPHVRDFLAKLSGSFDQEVARDLAGFRNALVRVIRRGLALKRGRPEDPRTEEAIRMIAEGKTFAEVLRSRVPRGADAWEVFLQGKRLDAALRRWRRKERIQKKKAKKS